MERRPQGIPLEITNDAIVDMRAEAAKRAQNRARVAVGRDQPYIDRGVSFTRPDAREGRSKHYEARHRYLDPMRPKRGK